MNITIKSSLKQWILIVIGIFASIFSLKAQEYSFKVSVSGSGQPVLLIPGISCDAAVWDETVSLLSEDYECHAVTLPGFAGEPPIKFDSSYLPVVKNELVKYLKSFDQKAIVIGHSLGGFLTLSISIENPEVVEKSIIVDAYPYFGASQNPNATVEIMKPMAETMKNNIVNASEEQALASQKMILPTMITNEDQQKVVLDWSMSSDNKTVGQAMYELFTTDLRPDLAKVKAPTLVLAAWKGYEPYGVTKDMIERNFTFQYAELENVKIQISDIGKHFIMWDDPEFYFEQIKSFLYANN